MNLNESLKDLDRLDGYKPVRSRPTASSGAPAPYPPVEPSTLGAAVLDFEQQYFGRRFDSFLVGADRARKEVNLKTLSASDRKLFDESMAKEWKSWLLFGAVIVVDPKDVPKDAQVVTTRWVHTDKNALAKSSGKRLPTLAKSRF